MDTISDMLTRIRNAQGVGKSDVAFPFSKIKMAIANILKDKGYVKKIEKEIKGSISNIHVTLKYDRDGINKLVPAISGIRKISKFGKRVYIRKGEIKKVKNGYGISIISTSRGVMTGNEARKLGIGGELICEVW
jgi:small subunit ribosomal protein S8